MTTTIAGITKEYEKSGLMSKISNRMLHLYK